MKPAYKRILLKLSGETLKGSAAFGVDPDTTVAVAQKIGEITRAGVQVALVIGAGNLFRGLPASKKDATEALLKQYESILVLLKSHGALLNAVKPEMLLELEDFSR